MNDNEAVWSRMHAAAAAVRRPRQISARVEAGGVAAAVMSESGAIYTGVCVDTSSSLGICAERAAVIALITAGEDEVRRVLAIMPDGKIGPPCGACREFLVQIMEGRTQDVAILLDYPQIRTATLASLTPQWWL